MSSPFSLFKRSGLTLGLELDSEGAAVVRASAAEKAGARSISAHTFAWGQEEGRDQLLYRKIREIARPRLPVITSLPLSDYQLVQIQPPRVKENEMRQAVSWQIKDLIDYPLDRSVIDVFSAPEAPGLGSMVYVVAANRDRVEQRINLLQQARLRLRAIDIPELVLRNVLRLEPESESTVALLHLERGAGVLLVYRAGVLYVARRLTSGMDHLLGGAAEAPESGLLEPDDMGSTIFDSLLLDVQRTLDYYESNFRASPVSTLLLAPQLGQEPRLQEHLQQNLDIPVRLLELDAHLGQELSYAEQGRCLPALGCALKQAE